MRSNRSHVTSVIALLVALACNAASASPVQLAQANQARIKVVVHPQAAPDTRRAAGELADYLSRMSGGTFEIENGDGARGLVVGLLAEFPSLASDVSLDPRKPQDCEAYLLRSSEGRLLVLGASPRGLRNAVWDVLWRLGHRQFYPGAHWEIVPRQSELRLNVDVTSRPSYLQRQLSYGYGYSAENREPYQRWIDRNRMDSQQEVAASHVYQAIIRANPDVFRQHPEYLSLVDGQRGGTKFCISNPQLRQFIVSYAVESFRKDPALQSISMEPSDGSSNWCECDGCKALGSISNRVVLLANEVAGAVNAPGMGEKRVGILAYGPHAQPPTIAVHPQVVVRVAMYGNNNSRREVQTRLKQLEAWKARGATVGVSDYLSTFVWDFALPGRAKGSDPQYVALSIDQFHQAGARYFNAAMGDNWALSGLGAYITARCLWDTSESQRVSELAEDFFEKAFGPARPAATEYFGLLNMANSPRLSEDLVGRMYRHLDRAYQLAANDAAVIARLDDLARYTRYVELYLRHRDARDNQKQTLLELMRHVHRVRDSSMCHVRAVRRELPKRAVITLEDSQWQIDEPFAPGELRNIVTQGVKRNRIQDFAEVDFGDDLVPISPALLGGRNQEVLTDGGNDWRGKIRLYTWVKQPGTLRLELTGAAGNRGTTPTEMRLFAAAQTTDEPVATHQQLLEEGKTRDIAFRTPFAGLHWLEVYGPRFRVKGEHPFTVRMGGEMSAVWIGTWSAYFFVPRGVKFVGGYAERPRGMMLDGDGKQVFAFTSMTGPGYYTVRVPPGQDGKLWRLVKASGEHQLLTVPPFLNVDASQLLLPIQVIDSKTDSSR